MDGNKDDWRNNPTKTYFQKRLTHIDEYSKKRVMKGNVTMMILLMMMVVMLTVMIVVLEAVVMVNSIAVVVVKVIMIVRIKDDVSENKFNL